ncbi:hypothetical protein PFISCL1PPCAC_23896, partial [Pristionchus fissidentatus]
LLLPPPLLYIQILVVHSNQNRRQLVDRTLRNSNMVVRHAVNEERFRVLAPKFARRADELLNILEMIVQFSHQIRRLSINEIPLSHKEILFVFSIALLLDCYSHFLIDFSHEFVRWSF